MRSGMATVDVKGDKQVEDVTIEGDGVLGLECSGRLGKEDFEQMHAWLDVFVGSCWIRRVHR